METPDAEALVEVPLFVAVDGELVARAAAAAPPDPEADADAGDEDPLPVELDGTTDV